MSGWLKVECLKRGFPVLTNGVTIKIELVVNGLIWLRAYERKGASSEFCFPSPHKKNRNRTMMETSPSFDLGFSGNPVCYGTGVDIRNKTGQSAF